jgi:hypothetical protein
MPADIARYPQYPSRPRSSAVRAEPGDRVAPVFGVRPTDPATLAPVVMTIVAVAIAARWLPAWRASRLDPNAVLRSD